MGRGRWAGGAEGAGAGWLDRLQAPGHRPPPQVIVPAMGLTSSVTLTSSTDVINDIQCDGIVSTDHASIIHHGSRAGTDGVSMVGVKFRPMFGVGGFTRRTHDAPPPLADIQVGFGRIFVSEIEAPNLVFNLV
jgi:hypothetical protein